MQRSPKSIGHTEGEWKPLGRVKNEKKSKNHKNNQESDVINMHTHVEITANTEAQQRRMFGEK
jgi:hypothetical protein